MFVDDIYTTLQARFAGELYPDTPPENHTATPFGIYTLISAAHTNLGNAFEARYQIDVFHTSRRTADALADNVLSDMAAATLFRSNLILRQELYEGEVRLYRVSLDFALWQ